MSKKTYRPKALKDQTIGAGRTKTINMGDVNIDIHRVSGGSVFITVYGFNSETVRLGDRCDKEFNYVSLEAWSESGQLVNLVAVGHVSTDKHLPMGKDENLGKGTVSNA